jgi:hypothetical protein
VKIEALDTRRTESGLQAHPPTYIVAACVEGFFRTPPVPVLGKLTQSRFLPD